MERREQRGRGNRDQRSQRRENKRERKAEYREGIGDRIKRGKKEGRVTEETEGRVEKGNNIEERGWRREERMGRGENIT